MVSVAGRNGEDLRWDRCLVHCMGKKDEVDRFGHVVSLHRSRGFLASVRWVPCIGNKEEVPGGRWREEDAG